MKVYVRKTICQYFQCIRLRLESILIKASKRRTDVTIRLLLKGQFTFYPLVSSVLLLQVYTHIMAVSTVYCDAGNLW